MTDDVRTIRAIALSCAIPCAGALGSDTVLATYTFADGLSPDNGGFIAHDLGVQQFSAQGAHFVREDDPDEAILIQYQDDVGMNLTHSFAEIVVRNTGHIAGGREGLMSFRNPNGAPGQLSLRFVTSLESDQSFTPVPWGQPQTSAHVELIFDDGVSDPVVLSTPRLDFGQWDVIRVEANPDALLLIVNGQVEDSAPVSFGGFGIVDGSEFRLGGQTAMASGSGTLDPVGFSGRVLSFAFGALGHGADPGTPPPPLVYAEGIEFNTAAGAPCDLDGDGRVGSADMALFLDGYAAGDSDFDASGTTDTDDMLAFAACVASPGAYSSLSGPDCCTTAIGERARLGVVRLQYTGLSCADAPTLDCEGDPALAPVVYIEATDKRDPDDGGGRVWFAGTVSLGAMFDVSAHAGGKDKLSDKTFIHVYADPARSVLLQTFRVDTKCDEPVRVGDALGCVRVVGALDRHGEVLGQRGVDEAEVLVWYGASGADAGAVSLQGYVETGCNRVAIATGETLVVRRTSTIPRGAIDLCAHDDKISEIDLRFTGDPCDASSHEQRGGSWGCVDRGTIADGAFVFVTDSEDVHDHDARIYYAGDVALGQVITARARAANKSQFESELYIHVLSDADVAPVTQSVWFGSKCDEPVLIGDRYGAFQVVSLESKNGIRLNEPDPDLACAATYDAGELTVTADRPTLLVVATDSGGRSSVASVTLVPGAFGSAGSSFSPCDEGRKPAVLTFVYTANPCGLSRNAQKPSKSGCDDGSQLPEFGTIRVTDHVDPHRDDATTYFEGQVMLGTTIRVDAKSVGDDELEKDVYLHVLDHVGNLSQTARVHASCSEPLVPGNTFGAFSLLDVE